MKTISKEDLLSMFDPEVHERLLDLAQQPGTAGLIVFENLMLDSSACGSRTAAAFGSSRTYKEPSDAQGTWLNDLPSQRQHPRYVYRRPKGQRTLWSLL